MHRLDEVTLMIALQVFDLETKVGCTFTRARNVVTERRGAIHLGFAGTEQIEVRSVKKQDSFAHNNERYRPTDSRYSTCGLR